MKRFFSFMMALAMLFSMSINAFAAEGTGSITITNATVDHVYTLYKIFDASYNADENGNTNGVSYSITTDNQFYSYMFNEDGTAKTDNVYFTYNAVTGAVTLNSSVNSPDAEAAMFAYLKAMVESGNYTPTAAPITATTQEVVFTDLPYGYYLIHKGSDAAVTIDSNTPDVEVIDKTQKPNVFDKQILNDDTNVWTDEISSNVGDREKFKITFTATNYDGEGHIQYYTVKDVNGDALLVDFYRFTVNVGNTAYTKGYYYNISDTTANDYVGTWADEDKDINKADWYIVRTAENAFQIVLPWQESHIFDATPEEGKGYITYTADSASKYASPVEVVIEYFATVEENANIGGVGMNENSNLKNTANLEWTYEGGSGGKGPEVTNIKVYALGVNKVDASTKEALAGAEFEVYRDERCTDKVFVTKKGENVYIHDTASQNNKVVTDANGKVVIIGLKEGTYYLKEVKAPDGYNVMTENKDVKIGTGENVGAVDTFYTYTANSITVENSKGMELPSTGGEGTMRMITIGSIVAIAFAVLLITNKKMSVYQD